MIEGLGARDGTDHFKQDQSKTVDVKRFLILFFFIDLSAGHLRYFLGVFRNVSVADITHFNVSIIAINIDGLTSQIAMHYVHGMHVGDAFNHSFTPLFNYLESW